MLSCLAGTVKDRIELHNARYKFLYDRCMSNESFTKHNKLSQIHLLLGSSGQKCILGLLINRGQDYYLEDPTGSVRLNLKQTQVGNGMFCEGSFVIIQGEMISKTELQVEAIVSPPIPTPIEQRDDILVDNDEKIVIVSEVFLDQSKVVKNLKLLLSNYVDYPPKLIVLMGSFISKPFKMENTNSYISHFLSLAKDFKELKTTKFVCIPGQDDPNYGNILPQPPIPSFISKSITDKIPNLEFVSNPCRISFEGKSLVFLRKNNIHKLRRLCVIDPDTSLDLYKHYIITLLSNAHLTPIPIQNQPIVWRFDSELMLKTAPDYMILSDKCEIYEFKSGNTLAMNPNSFSFDTSFIELNPHTGVTNWVKME
jgi:DNA polymerase epsilon subunit 2